MFWPSFNEAVSTCCCQNMRWNESDHSLSRNLAIPYIMEFKTCCISFYRAILTNYVADALCFLIQCCCFCHRRYFKCIWDRLLLRCGADSYYDKLCWSWKYYNRWRYSTCHWYNCHELVYCSSLISFNLVRTKLSGVLIRLSTVWQYYLILAVGDLCMVDAPGVEISLSAPGKWSIGMYKWEINQSTHCIPLYLYRIHAVWMLYDATAYETSHLGF